MHSGTKYISGHSDVLLGLVTTSPNTKQGKALNKKLRNIQQYMGIAPAPFDIWLTIRGLRTLYCRIEKSCYNAKHIAIFLNNHRLIEHVYYPGFDNRENVVKKQMKLYGGMLSFDVGNEELAMAITGSVQVVTRATSLGGTKTLIEHRASIEPEERRVSPPGLLRLSVGIEDVDDLIDDLQIAFDVAEKVCS